MGYFRIKFTNDGGFGEVNRGYGRGGDGGSGGDGRGSGASGDDEATPPTPPRVPFSPPPTSPSRHPRALPTSPPPLQQPPPPRSPADMDSVGEPDNRDLREEENQAVEDDKEPLLDLIQEHSKRIITGKIEILSQQYAHFRRTPEVSSCFYRAFLFCYLENLGQLPDRQGEVTRLMEHVATSKDSFCGLPWVNADISAPEQYFSSVMDEFDTLVNSVANGMSSDELFKSCLQATRSPRIISLLRLLAETDMRTGGEGYEALYPENFDALSYCIDEVRRTSAKTQVLAIRALTYALGIPLRVETMDGALTDGTAKVKRIDFFPRSESGKSSYHAYPCHWSSITAPDPQQMGSGDLLSFDRTPLLTLMCTRNPYRWYILYREGTDQASTL